MLPKNKVSGDYSSFDQNMPSHFIVTAFLILKNTLKLNAFQEKVFSLLVSYFLHCRIYHPITGTVFRERGIYSGSYFTSIIGSICNTLLLNYGSDGPFTEFVSGDDVILTDFKIGALSDIKKSLKMLGLQLNFERTFKRNEYGWSFLGSNWYKAGPERSVTRMILGAIIVKRK